MTDINDVLNTAIGGTVVLGVVHETIGRRNSGGGSRTRRKAQTKRPAKRTTSRRTTKKMPGVYGRADFGERKFDGKRYRQVGGSMTKPAAKKLAEKYRRAGNSARVSHAPSGIGGWFVWVR
jgi:hypothetical protein